MRVTNNMLTQMVADRPNLILSMLLSTQATKEATF